MIPTFLQPADQIKKALVETVLPQQAPDAEVLYINGQLGVPERMNSDGLASVGILSDDLKALPDVVAYSNQHDCVFLIETVHNAGPGLRSRQAEFVKLSRKLKCRSAIVVVFASRESFLAQMSDIAYGAHVWFANEPKRSAFLSDSPEASARYWDTRISARTA